MTGAMVVVWLVVLGLGLAVATIALALRTRELRRDIGRRESAVRRLRALQAEAAELAASRGRFRRRQRGVQRAVDSGTRGVETAHRSLATRFGWPAGEGVYRGLRGINRTLGRSVTALFAPTTAARRRESLAEWRARRQRDRDHHDD